MQNAPVPVLNPNLPMSLMEMTRGVSYVYPDGRICALMVYRSDTNTYTVTCGFGSQNRRKGVDADVRCDANGGAINVEIWNTWPRNLNVNKADKILRKTLNL